MTTPITLLFVLVLAAYLALAVALARVSVPPTERRKPPASPPRFQVLEAVAWHPALREWGQEGVLRV